MFEFRYDSKKQHKADWFFDQQRVELRTKGYVWGAYLLALQDRSSALYEQISNSGSDIDIISGHSIAFLVVNNNLSRNGDSLRRYSQYTTNGRDIRESNVDIIPYFQDKYDIPINLLPCLVFFNVHSDDNGVMVIRLNNDSNISDIMEYISIRSEEDYKRINDIHDAFQREFKDVEKYYDMKKRLIACSLESRLYNEDEINRILVEFETSNSDYATSRLLEMWKDVDASLNRKIYGNYKGGLASRLVEQKNEICDFDVRMSQYEDLRLQLDDAIKHLYDAINLIDTLDCVSDACYYMDRQIEAIEEIFNRNAIDDECSQRTISKLKEALSGISNRSLHYNKLYEVIDDLRASRLATYLDDYGRVVTLVTIIAKIGEWAIKCVG